MGLGVGVTTTQTTEVALKPAVKVKLLRNLRAYADLCAQIKALEEKADIHKAAVRELREEAGVEKLQIEGFTTTNVPNLRTSLDKQKLLAMGVTVDMLEEATVTKPGRPYERITPPGSKRAAKEDE